jgi:hypothetical protein
MSAFRTTGSLDPSASRPGGPAPSQEARLNEAVTVLWRGRRTVQLELGRQRLVVEDIDSDDLKRLLPARGEGGAGPGDAAAASDPHAGGAAGRRPEGDHQGPEAGDWDRLRARLGAAGLLREPTPAAQPSAAFGGRLAPDLRALTARVGSQAGELLTTRGRSAIAVHGSTRLAGTLAATLAAAGVGWIQLTPGGDVRADHASPGGVTPADEGRRFAAASAEALRRAAPEVRTAPIPHGRGPDLVILTEGGPADPSMQAGLHLDRVPHLRAAVEGDHAIVGPLVLPGTTSCLRCADLHRTDRDPAWPLLAVQLAGKPTHRAASDVALCVAAAGLAAGQALAFLDLERPAVLDATLEWQLPDWRLRRRSWPPHERCDCRALRDERGHGRMAQ